MCVGRVSDQAVLQWGAKRDLIRKMHNAAPRHTVVERVLSAVRVLLTRAQKKQKRRKARRESARQLKPVNSFGGGVPARLGAGVGGGVVLAT